MKQFHTSSKTRIMGKERNKKVVEGTMQASRILCFLRLIFHPAVLALAIILVLTGLRVHQIIRAIRTTNEKSEERHFSGYSSLNVSTTPAPRFEFINPPTTAIPKRKRAAITQRVHKRVKRSESSNDDDTPGEPDAAAAAGGDDESIERTSESDIFNSVLDDEDDSIERDDKADYDEDASQFTDLLDRRAALSSIDDMLLDGETTQPSFICLNDEEVEDLEAQQQANLEALREKDPNAELSEFLEPCEHTSDCLILSPYFWIKDGSGEECRKKTYLRCNSAEKTCQCTDRFDLRWDAIADQTIYQWNPITKTCYVRGTNPCKLEIPCAPGTVCRSTVSISYNTPPIQRLCECGNIEHIIKATNKDWWYCAEYYQRNWVFDLDNILKWKHTPFHLYEKMKASKFLTMNLTVKTKALTNER